MTYGFVEEDNPWDGYVIAVEPQALLTAGEGVLWHVEEGGTSE
jgi:hypothetical protein